MDNTLEKIKADIKTYRIILFMKGSKLMPSCGFSSRVVAILNELEASFEARNVLEDDDLRQGIKDYSNWPTIPQLYIDGKFIGGCDIITELYSNGELQKLV